MRHCLVSQQIRLILQEIGRWAEFLHRNGTLPSFIGAEIQALVVCCYWDAKQEQVHQGLACYMVSLMSYVDICQCLWDRIYIREWRSTCVKRLADCWFNRHLSPIQYHHLSQFWSINSMLVCYVTVSVLKGQRASANKTQALLWPHYCVHYSDKSLHLTVYWTWEITILYPCNHTALMVLYFIWIYVFFHYSLTIMTCISNMHKGPESLSQLIPVKHNWYQNSPDSFYWLYNRWKLGNEFHVNDSIINI